MKTFSFFLMVIFLAGCNLPEPYPYFVFLNTNPDRELLPDSVVQDLQSRHLANIDSLARAGIITGAGPFDSGGGIFIMQANNLKHAARILETDPAISANRFIIEILPLKFVKGGNCKYDDPLEMITVGFFRFSTNDNYLPANRLEHFKQRILDLAGHDDVLALAEFDKQGNGFMLLNLELNDEWTMIISDDPVFQENLMDLTIKNLWIAKGTFCQESSE